MLPRGALSPAAPGSGGERASRVGVTVSSPKSSSTVNTANYQLVKHISWVYDFSPSFRWRRKTQADATLRRYYCQGPASCCSTCSRRLPVYGPRFIGGSLGGAALAPPEGTTQRARGWAARPPARPRCQAGPVHLGFPLTASPRTSGPAKCSAINL